MRAWICEGLFDPCLRQLRWCHLLKATSALLVGMASIALPVYGQDPGQEEREAMYYRYLDFASYVRGGSVQPHWMEDGNSFWYGDGPADSTVIYTIDPVANTKTELFDMERLRTLLAAELGDEPAGRGLPFSSFTFTDKSENAIRFALKEQEFVLQLDGYKLRRVSSELTEAKNRFKPKPFRKGYWWDYDVFEALSPDSIWFAAIKDHNLWLRSPSDERMVQLTTDGTADYAWGLGIWGEWQVRWSPDSGRLALQKGDFRNVFKLPIVRWLEEPEKVEWVHYPKVGGALPRIELFIIDINSKKQVRVDGSGEPDQLHDIVGWRPDGSELLFFRYDRLGEKMELVAVDPATGAVRTVLEETEPGPRLIGIRRWYFLEDWERFIWLSERDGWYHLYLYGLDGTLIRRLTEGEFEVVRVVTVDEKAGDVYFTARADPLRPYDAHLYRVSLEGGSVTRLTEAAAQHDSHASPHRIQFSPSKAYFLDTHSTVSTPPVVELRRADGALLQTVARADIDALLELGWVRPEEFVVKAADGETDLHGVLFKPYDFDRSKRYPVIDFIYPGPQYYVHPDIFDARFYPTRARALAQLGFIVFIVDGRGTIGRGRAFRHVIYRNIGRHEIPDHMATLKQLADTRPYMDLDRVGILGHSWGGYFALRAMLSEPDVYHVGVAARPLVDLEDGGAWFEAWAYMGLPGENEAGYEFSSNRRLAESLRGKLLLIHCTRDVAGSPFSGAMKMAAALIEAEKPFDMLVLPDEPHGWSGANADHAYERIRSYLQEHLKP